jgi:CheY-like chemotaxis protein
MVDSPVARATATADLDTRGLEAVLLVEDDPAVMKMTRRMLTAHGYHVLATRSPLEAIRAAEEHAAEIRLLMTDVVMPEMNGRDLAARVLSINPHIKQLFVSGYPADVIATRGMLDERVHFLQKPYTDCELATKVRELLGNG